MPSVVSKKVTTKKTEKNKNRSTLNQYHLCIFSVVSKKVTTEYTEKNINRFTLKQFRLDARCILHSRLHERIQTTNEGALTSVYLQILQSVEPFILHLLEESRC